MKGDQSLDYDYGSGCGEAEYADGQAAAREACCVHDSAVLVDMLWLFLFLEAFGPVVFLLLLFASPDFAAAVAKPV